MIFIVMQRTVGRKYSVRGMKRPIGSTSTDTTFPFTCFAEESPTFVRFTLKMRRCAHLVVVRVLSLCNALSKY
jgi:hypothetical protein